MHRVGLQDYLTSHSAARLTQTIGVRVQRDGLADHDENGIEMAGGQTTTVLIEV